MSGVAAAATLAAAVERVILVIGTDLSLAAESHDAVSIELSAGQQQLITSVTNASKAPVIVVLLTATPLDISALLSNPKIGAILHAGQPAVAVMGVGDVLFGKKVPAGRLVQTILPSSYADSVSIFDFGLRPGPSNYPRPDCTLQPWTRCPNATNPGRTYRFYTGTPVLPFGFGLSYTTFSYKVIGAPRKLSADPIRQLLQKTADAGRTFTSTSELASYEIPGYHVNVTNTGSMDADDVVSFVHLEGAEHAVVLAYASAACMSVCILMSDALRFHGPVSPLVSYIRD